LREEAGTLKPDDLEQRRRVYENITRLDPTDAEAAEQHERVIAEIGKVSSLSDRKLCAKLHSDNANIVYLQEY
jgi:hypothetical protein